MKALDLKLMRDLIHMRGQVLAIVLIVACGLTAMVTMMSAYESLKLSQATYYAEYRLADVFASLKRAPAAIAPRLAEIPGVIQVQTRVVVDVTLDVPGLEAPATGRIVSIPADAQPMLNDLFIRKGRYIDPSHRQEVLISEAFAAANNLELGDRLGAVINGRWEALQIVGLALSPEYVYEIRPTDIVPDNRRFGVIWMGRDALATAFDLEGAFNDVALSLSPRARLPEVLFQLDQRLQPYGGLGAYGREDQISNRFLSEEIASLRVSAVFIPMIFLGIAAFLLNIVLSRVISNQRDQIAVLKAFGYSNRAVGGHYFKLVLLITLAGGALGAALGLWLGSLITQYYTHFFQFPVLRFAGGAGVILSAIALSGGAALVGAFSSVQHAVSLPPAEAMRPAAPPQFRPTLVERWGLQGVFSASGRIIVRNLERKPVQSLLSILGIALAIAILMVGRYMGDAIHYIIDIQFRQVQREDVTLVFNEPRPARARYALAHLPGVMQAEPFRTVAARLRYEHRSHRTGLQGLDPEGELRNLLDRKLRPIALPPSGVLLTRTLGNMLGVKPGDFLTVEVLEGQRPTFTLEVMGLVDELIGVSAYMDLNALNGLMQEGQTLSGAYLTVDRQAMADLYDEVKQTPAIAGIALRQTTLDQFQETIGSSLGLFTAVLVIFACIIAFGVVYNAARIALSERGRELAILRIIGFSQTEIAVILLGEQAILTLLAIPVGFGIGWALVGLLASTYDSELYRLPFVVNRATYLFAAAVVLMAAGLSGWLIHRQLKRLDLIAVLKTRE
ncbi:ABC transporter permease [Lyngbya confervoides]|uniref:FtsX-like permease family protein n=1 Tax=Lyngbya confervoides BDU141951 TaxID=1574623 RepID=A0ABD4T579_9CYAN|nr:FtsX-like permease family protein [Lyngbya confervoides]MCM1983744.1 FtsX-like permease family protein [Lyngbya confervoides BDU141951]